VQTATDWMRGRPANPLQARLLAIGLNSLHGMPGIATMRRILPGQQGDEDTGGRRLCCCVNQQRGKESLTPSLPLVTRINPLEHSSRQCAPTASVRLGKLLKSRLFFSPGAPCSLISGDHAGGRRAARLRASLLLCALIPVAALRQTLPTPSPGRIACVVSAASTLPAGRHHHHHPHKL